VSGRGTVTAAALIVAIELLAMAAPLPRAGQPTSNPGKAVFDGICAGCHGPDGAGDIGPRLVPFTRSSRELLAVVREGVGMMPALSARDISDDEVAAVAEFLKSLSDKPAAE
jgi:mono/diheme cytochrome c family protein